MGRRQQKHECESVSDPACVRVQAFMSLPRVPDLLTASLSHICLSDVEKQLLFSRNASFSKHQVTEK